jgi:hypothetical protein
MDCGRIIALSFVLFAVMGLLAQCQQFDPVDDELNKNELISK